MFLQSGRNKWKLNLKDNTIYNTDQKHDVLWRKPDKWRTHTLKRPTQRWEKTSETRGGHWRRAPRFRLSAISAPFRVPVAWGVPCNMGVTGSSADFPGTNVVTSILQKSVTQKQLALGIPFPEVPPARPPHHAPTPKPQGVRRSLLYLNGCCLLVLLINSGSEENGGSGFHAKAWRRWHVWLIDGLGS